MVCLWWLNDLHEYVPQDGNQKKKCSLEHSKKQQAQELSLWDSPNFSLFAIGVRFSPSGVVILYFLLLFFFFFPPLLSLSLFYLPHTPQLVGSQFTGRRWGMRPCGWVRSSGVTENVRSQEILIRVKYPRGSHLNTKTWPYPTACKLHFWKCQARQLARWE